MKCPICKTGETKPGFVTVTLNKNNTTVVIKEVPADVCTNCGEYYLSEVMTDDLLTRAENAIQKGVEIEILKYAA